MLNVSIPAQEKELCPKIIVIGVGGAGGNAVDNMIESSLEGVDFMVCNTDAQALGKSLCDNRVQLGGALTQGLGAGSQPEVGRAAAEESIEEVIKQLDGMNMAFVTCGMGGGTGTGAAPVIAKAAKEKGLLTVGVVTKPFHFEGAHRMRLAEAGIEEMQEYVDTLIMIPNQNLFRIANEKTTFSEAFKMADSVLQSGVRGVTDLMIKPGLINLDFADVRCAMMEMGKAMMGTGESSGEGRAVKAAESAINNPLLDDISMKGARGVIINITGGYDMTLYEVDEACNRIRDEVDTDANIIFGSTFDDKLEGVMRVSVVATGIEGEALRNSKPLRPAAMNPVRGTQDITSAGVETKGMPQREMPKAESQGAVQASETAAMSSLSDIQEQDMFDMSPKKTIQPVGAGAASGAGVTGGQQTQYDPSFFAASPTGGVSGFSVPSMQSMQAGMGQGTMMSASTPAEYGQTHIDEPQTSGSLALSPQQHNDDVQTNTEALRGQRVGEAFIPPQPMQPSDQAPASTAQVQKRKSAAGSSLVLNPPKAPVQNSENAGQKKSSSLFERFTGAYKSLRNAYIEEDFNFSQEADKQPQQTRPSGQSHSNAMQQPQKPNMQAPQGAAAQHGASSSVFSSLGHETTNQPQSPKQQQLNMDLAQPKLKEKQEADKTDLDIPAFLRRQAN